MKVHSASSYSWATLAGLPEIATSFNLSNIFIEVQ